MEAMVYSKKYEMVDYGPDHPFRRERFTNTLSLFRRLFPGITIVEPEPINPSLLHKVHERNYVNLVKKLSELGDGFLSLDTPVFKGIFEWALWYCAGSLTAGKLVVRGYGVTFNPCGGLHHAKADSDGGFCVFNDVALLARVLEEEGFRIAIVDYDAHAGDGTMHILFGEPILKISIHEDPNFLYPGDGFPEQVGSGAGYGYTLNIPVPPFSGDDILLAAFREITIPALKKFSPDVIIVQSGVDGHHTDPLTHLRYTAHGYLQVAELLRGMGKPIVMLGGGGYNLDAVPKLWALIFAKLARKDAVAQELAQQLDRHRTESSEEAWQMFERTKRFLLENHPYLSQI